MRKDEVKIGHTYIAKVSDKLTHVRIVDENPHGGWNATNIKTGKNIRIKSAAKLRGPAAGDEDAGSTTPERKVNKPAKAADPDRVPLNEAMRPAKAVKGSKAKTPKAPKAEKPKKTSGLDAAHQVLTDAGQPMRCKDMVDKMLGDGLWKTGGKTPGATIYAAILREIQTKGEQARFKKTDRGLFAAA